MTRKIEIRREEYERRVLRTLREELLGGDALVEREGRIEGEDVRLDAPEEPHLVHILFRETARRECLFGFWSEAVEWDTEPSADTIVLDVQRGYWGPKEWASTLIVTWFMEQVEAVGHGLPPDCDPEGVTWVNGYRQPRE